MTRAIRIIGTGSAFPKQRVTNDDIARRLEQLGIDTNDRWIRARTGIRERRYSDLQNPQESNAGLGVTAASRALEMAGKSSEDIDLIIVATCSPDTMIPSTACWLQHEIGAKRAWAMDINAACTGFLYGVVTASQFLLTNQIRTALVIGSEVLNPFMNWHDRGSCILFGDGAGAAVLEAVPADNQRRILSWHLHSDGKYSDLLFIPAAGEGRKTPVDTTIHTINKLTMNGREIFKVAVRTLTKFAKVALKENNIGIDDLDWFIPHQANYRILEAVAQRLGLPSDKMLINVDRYGNTSAATIPTMLDEAVRDGRIKEGQLLLLDAFGAGFTYGSMVIRW